MADLTGIQSSQSVKIVGNDSTGAETNPVNSDTFGNLQVVVNAGKGTLTDRSGTATSASTQIMAANASREYIFIQNTGSKIIWFNFTTAAVAASPSIQLAAGSVFTMENSFISTEAIFIISASLTSTFTAKEG
jgi:hypothetical protein